MPKYLAILALVSALSTFLTRKVIIVVPIGLAALTLFLFVFALAAKKYGWNHDE